MLILVRIDHCLYGIEILQEADVKIGLDMQAFIGGNICYWNGGREQG